MIEEGKSWCHALILPKNCFEGHYSFEGDLVKPVYLPGYKPTYLCLMHMMT
jgi:hypothetical protein